MRIKNKFIPKVDSVTKRRRWKLLEFFNKLSRCEINTYGFPSNKCSLIAGELSTFKSDLLMMIKNIEFRKITDLFQL